MFLSPVVGGKFHKNIRKRMTPCNFCLFDVHCGEKKKASTNNRISLILLTLSSFYNVEKLKNVKRFLKTS